jgi:hypothetical protein
MIIGIVAALANGAMIPFMGYFFAQQLGNFKNIGNNNFISIATELIVN